MSESVNNGSGGSWSTMSENILNDKYPLHRACRDGDVTTLATLLEEQPVSKSHLVLEDAYYGWTPTHWAAYFGRLDCMRVLCGMNKMGLSTPSDLRTTRFSQTPSHIAAFAGHPQCLQWLLQAGAMPDARDYLGETPLHKSARSGSTECVSLLAAQKSHIGNFNNNGQTAANLADACGHNKLAEYILQLEAAQVRDTTASITRSIPTHGLNAGLFPPNHTNGSQIANKSQNLVKPLISSNGYYGFQSTNQISNGQVVPNGTPVPGDSDDCDMETDAASVTKDINSSSVTNGQQNGIVSNGSNLDVTLNHGVSQNSIPIGGRKRSREDSSLPDMKRSRREGPENVLSIAPKSGSLLADVPPKPATQLAWAQEKRTEVSNTGFITAKPLPGSKTCLGSMIDHSCSVGVEKVYEMMNIEMMMTEMHGC